jgi:hypothetical protein
MPLAQTHPSLFYSALFLLTYQIATLFTDVRARAHSVGRTAWHTVMSLGLASVDLAAPDHRIAPFLDDHAPLLSGEMLACRTDGQCRVKYTFLLAQVVSKLLNFSGRRTDKDHFGT